MNPVNAHCGGDLPRKVAKCFLNVLLIPSNCCLDRGFWLSRTTYPSSWPCVLYAALLPLLLGTPSPAPSSYTATWRNLQTSYPLCTHEGGQGDSLPSSPVGLG